MRESWGRFGRKTAIVGGVLALFGAAMFFISASVGVLWLMAPSLVSCLSAQHSLLALFEMLRSLDDTLHEETSSTMTAVKIRA
jgi:hypothetical protein